MAVMRITEVNHPDTRYVSSVCVSLCSCSRDECVHSVNVSVFTDCVLNVFVVERGKGRQRQAILGEHPSSYSDNGYGQSSSV